MSELLKSVERLEANPNIPALRTGDTVRVHSRIVEGNRERIQLVQGVIIRMKKGGPAASFTVRRIGAHGIGVERTFPFHSPRVEKVEVLRAGDVRRAKLYYLRGLRGKAARVRERRRLAETPAAPQEGKAE
jgi:large subunit ribosomal protein L19